MVEHVYLATDPVRTCILGVRVWRDVYYESLCFLLGE